MRHQHPGEKLVMTSKEEQKQADSKKSEPSLGGEANIDEIVMELQDLLRKLKEKASCKEYLAF